MSEAQNLDQLFNCTHELPEINSANTKKLWQIFSGDDTQELKIIRYQLPPIDPEFDERTRTLTLIIELSGDVFGLGYLFENGLFVAEVEFNSVGDFHLEKNDLYGDDSGEFFSAKEFLIENLFRIMSGSAQSTSYVIHHDNQNQLTLDEYEYSNNYLGHLFLNSGPLLPPR